MAAVAMKASSNRWLGLLGAAVVLSSARISVESYSYSLSFSFGPDCIDGFFADGNCDEENNNAECGYDWGDCCSCTCVDTENYTCGSNGFPCIDPTVTCVDDDGVTAEEPLENCEYVDAVGDSYCDLGNNNAGCAYDGGDCCSCTCEPGENPDYYSCSEFACIDPEATCVDDDFVTVDIVENCHAAKGLGNGYCDSGNNRAECAYDAGDCCPCTCVRAEGDSEYVCRTFDCIDPEAPCVNDDDITVEPLENCEYVDAVGDGYCNLGNNNAGCAYDGGDCCSCTCEPGEDVDVYSCSEFACIDPEATCVDDDDVTDAMVENCQYATGIGNGYCDEGNNKAECAYDAGDCCPCTCVRTEGDSEYVCRTFDCIDPEAPCVNDDDITVEPLENCEYVDAVGDSYCNLGNNNAGCAYDGGDCCSCTCEPGENPDYYSCSEFACIDPKATCVDDDFVTEDIVENCHAAKGLGNGYCDSGNNRAECAYDAGDCCSCTCVREEGDSEYVCRLFDCIDPEAPCVGDGEVSDGEDDGEEPMSYDFIRF